MPGSRAATPMVGGQDQSVVGAKRRDVRRLTRQIAGIARLDLQLFDHVFAQLAEVRPDHGQPGHVDIGQP